MKTNFNHDRHRNDAAKSDLNYRALALRMNADGTPSTLDKAARSVDVIGASENPVTEFDYNRYEYIPTVLLMSGCQIPANGQMPLLDTHSRYSTAAVIGSYRNMRIEGDLLVGRAIYSSVPEAEGPWTKTVEGHLTDYSVGRRDIESVFVSDDQTQIVNGKTFIGPVRVVTKWIPKEMSVCPIGADETAKARAAAPPQKNPEKEKKMDEKLRKYLERRGLAATATEDEAYRFLDTLDTRAAVSQPAAPAVPAVTPRSEDEIRTEAIKHENNRAADISVLCDRHDIAPEKRAGYLKPGVTVEQVRKEILDCMVDRAGVNNPGFKPSITLGADERDKFRSAASDALLIRAGRAPEKAAAGASDLTGFSLRELARESLRLANQSDRGDVLEMVGRSLTTSDFPLILANIANKSLFSGYEAASETWAQWCGTGSVSDFKTNTVVRAGETADLDQIREDDEYKYGTRAEAQEQFSIATYGKLFAISRQTIINDDLGALTDIPASHGEAAARKVGDLAYAVLTANAAMGDGTALFHANHGNLGTTGVIGATTFAEAFKLMLLQKDIGGKRRLNIKPQFLLISPALAYAAETFIKTTLIGTQAAPNQPNIYANSVQIVSEARLYDDSTTAWYLAGNKGKTVNVYFLNGNQTPFMETKQGWSIDGVEYKVRIDAGAKAIDWKSLFKNAGA